MMEFAVFYVCPVQKAYDLPRYSTIVITHVFCHSLPLFCVEVGEHSA